MLPVCHDADNIAALNAGLAGRDLLLGDESNGTLSRRASVARIAGTSAGFVPQIAV